jgi:hypothetical protein
MAEGWIGPASQYLEQDAGCCMSASIQKVKIPKTQSEIGILMWISAASFRGVVEMLYPKNALSKSS